jgi:hypothetical protein
VRSKVPQNSCHSNGGAGQHQEVAQPLNSANALQARRVNGAKPKARRRDQFRFQRTVRAHELDFVVRPPRAQFAGHGQGGKDVPARPARDHQDAGTRRGAVLIHDFLDKRAKNKSKGKMQKAKVKAADHASGRPALFTFAFCLLHFAF